MRSSTCAAPTLRNLRLCCRQQHDIRVVEIADGKMKVSRDYHRPLPVMAAYAHSVLLLHDEEYHLVFPRQGKSLAAA